MPRKAVITVLVCALAIGCAPLVFAQHKGGSTLTAEDYMEIQQLYARYNNAIDSGDAEGWADTFVPDGKFNTNTGREALIGFIHNWREKMNGANRRHWNSNLLINATPEGASGSVYLLLIDVGVRPPAIFAAAKYDDQLVKTPQGWRFKKRTTKAETPAPAPPAEKK